MANLCENMTSVTKLEVHNVFQCRYSRTYPLLRIVGLRTENFVKFGRVVFDIMQAGRQTNRHTDTLVAILRTPTGVELIINTDKKNKAVKALALLRIELLYCAHLPLLDFGVWAPESRRPKFNSPRNSLQLLHFIKQVHQ